MHRDRLAHVIRLHIGAWRRQQKAEPPISARISDKQASIRRYLKAAIRA
jgi:hypothetical protein